MRGHGLDTLKPYTGSLPGKTGTRTVPRRPRPAGSKPLVSLPGPLSPNEREPVQADECAPGRG